MRLHSARSRARSGFTLIETMIVVAIIGVIGSIAIPILMTYQMRSRSTEARTNLAAIRVAEEVSYSENGLYVSASAEPGAIPGSSPSAFDTLGSDFADLGWAPEGRVYFSYAIAIAADASGFTADAAADLDGDGVVQLWGFMKPSNGGVSTHGALGCDPARMGTQTIGPCQTPHGVF
jgi:type IV pilus assembly protein PilA